VRGENSLGETTVVSHATPIVKHTGDPVTQSKDRHWREVQTGQNLLSVAGKADIIK